MKEQLKTRPDSAPQTNIRFAAKDDIPTILRFIRELAEFEKLSHEVVADEETMAHHLFGEKPRAECLIAEIDDNPAGFALFFHNFSTFRGKPGLYLEDLYVKPAYRDQGLGKKFFR